MRNNHRFSLKNLWTKNEQVGAKLGKGQIKLNRIFDFTFLKICCHKLIWLSASATIIICNWVALPSFLLATFDHPKTPLAILDPNKVKNAPIYQQVINLPSTNYKLSVIVTTQTHPRQKSTYVGFYMTLHTTHPPQPPTTGNSMLAISHLLLSAVGFW